MGIRPHSFAVGEIYHCYNRGVEKRHVFQDAQDFRYFLNGLNFYNKKSATGKMRDFSKVTDETENVATKGRLVDIHAYCLNENHFHLILEELVEAGVSKFMHKVATSYVMYFNKKNERSGSLFQGKFKSVHVDSDVYLQHLGVYVNLNNLVHGISDEKRYRSSMHEYTTSRKGICKTELLARGKPSEYERYASDMLPSILERKQLLKSLTYSEFID